MSQYVYLQGSEAVQNAGHAMARAAEGMRDAAGIICSALGEFRRTIEQGPERLEIASNRVVAAMEHLALMLEPKDAQPGEPPRPTVAPTPEFLRHTKIMVAVDAERRYQDERHGTIGQHAHTIAEWAVLLLDRVHRVTSAYAEHRSPSAALEEVIKIAALAFACLEQHGVPECLRCQGEDCPRHHGARYQVPF